MALYTLLATGGVKRSDGAVIPEDERNADWRDYLAWRNAGNTPAPTEVLPPPPRYLVEKLKVVDRIIAAGLFTAYEAAMPMLPAEKRERWQAATSVWNDDPDVAGFITMIGGVPSEVLAP